MDQALLRNYLATVYELPTAAGPVRASLDGDAESTNLPDLLQQTFALVTAYNPRSMLLPRRVNEQRHVVLRDLLVLGCYRVENCVGFEEDPDGTWREPAWIVHGMDREEAVAYGRVFRQNAVVFSKGGSAELIITDPTCDNIGRTFSTHWRIRS
jgi:Protein of unknown function (DUF3293)